MGEIDTEMQVLPRPGIFHPVRPRVSNAFEPGTWLLQKHRALLIAVHRLVQSPGKQALRGKRN